MLELSGEKQLNHESAANSVLASIGFRVNLNILKSFQPRIGIGYVFPVTESARMDVHHGLYTSIVLDF